MDKGGPESIKYAKEIRERAVLLDQDIGSLEKRCGYSPGYLAKCIRGNSRLSIDAIVDFGNELAFNFLSCKL